MYPLHSAIRQADVAEVKKCISAGFDLNALDDVGQSPLHCAVFGGHADIVRLLLEVGADPNILSSDGVSPCWRARDFGLQEIELVLREFGGCILTGNGFDRTSFRIFNELIGVTLPKEE